MLEGYISEGNSLNFEVFACGIKNYNIGIAGKILFISYATIGKDAFILRSPNVIDQNLPEYMDYPQFDTSQNKEEANKKLYENTKEKLTELIRSKFPNEKINFTDYTSFVRTI